MALIDELVVAPSNTDTQEIEKHLTPAPEIPVAETGTGIPPAKVKRGPGRPSNAERAARGEAVPEKKPRAAKPKKPDNSALSKNLMGLHAAAAMIAGNPILQLQQTEADALADGIVAVCDEYELELDGKTGAAIQLLGACAMIYLPRVLAIRQQRIEQQKQNGEVSDS